MTLCHNGRCFVRPADEPEERCAEEQEETTHKAHNGGGLPRLHMPLVQPYERPEEKEDGSDDEDADSDTPTGRAACVSARAHSPT